MKRSLRSCSSLRAALARAGAEHNLDGSARAGSRRSQRRASTLQVAVLTRPAARIVSITEQESYYQFMLQLDANGSVGNTPQLALGAARTDPLDERPLAAFDDPAAACDRLSVHGKQLDLGAQLLSGAALGHDDHGPRRRDPLRCARIAAADRVARTSSATGPGYGFNAQLTVSQSLLRGFGETVGYAPLYQARADRAGFDATRDRTGERPLARHARRVLGSSGTRSARSRSSTSGARRHPATARRCAAAIGSRSARGRRRAARSEAQLAAIETTIATAELTVANAGITLARLLGRREGAVLPSTQPQPPHLSTVATANAIGEAVDQAPEVIEARAASSPRASTSTIAGQALMLVLNIGATFEVAAVSAFDDVGQTFSTFGSLTAVQFLGTLTYQTPLDDTQIHMEQERAQIAIEIAQQNYQVARAQAMADATTALPLGPSGGAPARALADHAVGRLAARAGRARGASLARLGPRDRRAHRDPDVAPVGARSRTRRGRRARSAAALASSSRSAARTLRRARAGLITVVRPGEAGLRRHWRRVRGVRTLCRPQQGVAVGDADRCRCRDIDWPSRSPCRIQRCGMSRRVAQAP